MISNVSIMLCSDVFRIAKITEMIDRACQITYFNYKLDVKNDFIMEEDILFNFGNVGNKSIFEMDPKQHKQLLNKLFHMDIVLIFLLTKTIIKNFLSENNSTSMCQLLIELKQKEEVRLFLCLKVNKRHPLSVFSVIKIK